MYSIEHFLQLCWLMTQIVNPTRSMIKKKKRELSNKKNGTCHKQHKLNFDWSTYRVRVHLGQAGMGIGLQTRLAVSGQRSRHGTSGHSTRDIKNRTHIFSPRNF